MEAQQPSKELFYVAGDVPDPTGATLKGRAPSYRLTQTALGHPMIFWRDMVLEADVYALPGQPLQVHLICPQCRNALIVRQGNKAIAYEPGESVPTPPNWTAAEVKQAIPMGLGGRISVESFACTWEANGEVSRDFGLARCGWRVAIENNIARDA